VTSRDLRCTIVSRFALDVPTLLATRAEQHSLMARQRAGSRGSIESRSFTTASLSPQDILQVFQIPARNWQASRRYGYGWATPSHQSRRMPPKTFLNLNETRLGVSCPAWLPKEMCSGAVCAAYRVHHHPLPDSSLVHIVDTWADGVISYTSRIVPTIATEHAVALREDSSSASDPVGHSSITLFVGCICM
jgi:hypothetical protein